MTAIKREIAARRGAPLLVNFWALWCEPCVAELPDLARIESRFASSGVRVMGVNCDLLVEDDSDSVRARVSRTLKTAGVAYPNFMYSGGQDALAGALGLPGAFPFSVLLGANGKELKRWTRRLQLPELEAELARVRRK